MSANLSAAEISELVGRLDAVAHDTTARLGGRLVKTIGDEAMFTAPAEKDIVEISLALLKIDGLPPLRAGVAAGDIVMMEGDCYGPVVNLASRLVHIAEPGTVATAHPVEGFPAEPRGQRDLKGIGPTEVWLIRPE